MMACAKFVIVEGIVYSIELLKVEYDVKFSLAVCIHAMVGFQRLSSILGKIIIFYYVVGITII